MSNKTLSVVLILVLSSYGIVARKCFGIPYDEDDNTLPNTKYSVMNDCEDSFAAPFSSQQSQEVGKQTLAFTFHRIYGNLTFPEECHAEDNITYDLTVAVEAGGVHLSFFALNISCNTLSGEEILYEKTIENTDLPETWILNETIALNIPADANGKVHCIIDAEICTTYHGKIEFDATTIRTITYEELQTAYDNLLSQYNATLEELEHLEAEYQNLNNTYNNLSDLHNSTVLELEQWKDEYQNLNSSYGNLSGLYEAAVSELQNWKTEYQNLNSTYNTLATQHNVTLDQLNQWINQFKTLNSTYNNLLNNYSSLNSNYQKLQSDYNTLKGSYAILNMSYLSLNSSHNSLQENYNTLLSEHNNLTEKYNYLNSTYQQLNLDYATLMQRNQELTHNLTLLQTEYENLSASYNLLNFTHYALVQENEDLRSIGDQLRLAIALLVALLAVEVAVAVGVVYSIRKKEK